MSLHCRTSPQPERTPLGMDWGWNRVSEHHGMHGWWLKVQHGSKTKYGIVRRMTSWIFRVTVVTAGSETA